MARGEVSEARLRLLTTATEIFYAEGIHAVGVDRIMAQDSSDAAARHFVMLRDGAMAAGCLFDPALVVETFLRGVEGLVRIHRERRPAQM